MSEESTQTVVRGKVWPRSHRNRIRIFRWGRRTPATGRRKSEGGSTTLGRGEELDGKLVQLPNGGEWKAAPAPNTERVREDLFAGRQRRPRREATG